MSVQYESEWERQRRAALCDLLRLPDPPEMEGLRRHIVTVPAKPTRNPARQHLRFVQAWCAHLRVERES